MKRINIIRTQTSEQGTFGALYIDGSFFCVTGELPKDYDGDNIENEVRRECIPQGEYKVAPREPSAKFKYDHYILEDVPNRSYILIHVGNFCGKVPKYKSNVEGCIILGEKVDFIEGQLAVTNSVNTFNSFMQLMNNEPFVLKITEDF